MSEKKEAHIKLELEADESALLKNINGSIRAIYPENSDGSAVSSDGLLLVSIVERLCEEETFETEMINWLIQNKQELYFKLVGNDSGIVH